MYMANKKGVSITANEFSRWFRKKLRDPFLNAVMQDDRIKEFLLVTFPNRLWEAVVRIEGNVQMNGLAKKQHVEREIASWLQAQGLQWLRPFILPYLETAVLYIYRDYFMDKFKRYGLHDVLEQWFNVDLDEDGDVGIPDVATTVEIVGDGDTEALEFKTPEPSSDEKAPASTSKLTTKKAKAEKSVTE